MSVADSVFPGRLGCGAAEELGQRSRRLERAEEGGQSDADGRLGPTAGGPAPLPARETRLQTLPEVRRYALSPYLLYRVWILFVNRDAPANSFSTERCSGIFYPPGDFVIA